MPIINGQKHKLKEFRRQSGFTLIELMIVVAIIGILAAVAIPKFAEMLRKSKEGATKGGLTNLRSALTIYQADNEGFVPMSNGQEGNLTNNFLVPKYIDAVPTVKLGTYHVDRQNVRISAFSPENRSDDILLSLNSDRNGWIYSSTGGGYWWVDCSHTDTKNQNFTSW